MIVINDPEIIYKKDSVVVRSLLEYDNIKEYLWFEFPIEYEKYIVTENSDAFVVALLFFAMKNGKSVVIKGTISEKLYYNLTHYLINALCLANNTLKKIEITANSLNSESLNYGDISGTGVSCGIDSFSTIYDHISSKGSFEIKYFTFLNVGSHDDFNSKRANRLFKERLEIVKGFAEESGKEIITVNSNISEILKMNFQSTHTLRSIAAILNLQKLFKYYYYASTYRFDHFKLNKNDTAYADILILSMLSTESTTFYSSVSQLTRVERTQLITGYDLTYKYLNVCASAENEVTANNCSVCFKCLRTQLTLELLGKLDLYSNVFKLDKYEKEKEYYIAQIMINRKTNVFDKEIYELMKEKKYKISNKTKWYYYRIKEHNLRLAVLSKLGLKK